MLVLMAGVLGIASTGIFWPHVVAHFRAICSGHLRHVVAVAFLDRRFVDDGRFGLGGSHLVSADREARHSYGPQASGQDAARGL